MFVTSVIPSRVRAALLIGLASFLVAGCQTDRIVTGTVPTDYRDRHPIQINEGTRVALMHIGSGRSGLTPEQRALAGGFASQWRRNASGPLTIELPAGVANEVASGRSVRELQSILVAHGVPPRAIQIRAYQPSEPSNIGPIRLVFPAVTAQVANRCHVGRDDLGVTPNNHSAQNYPTTNFGCATQHNLAASVANPEDLVQPRNEQPGYAARRRTVIDKYRQGQDPSTVYQSTTQGAVSTVGR
jgi:pilus assembly protein CpaD